VTGGKTGSVSQEGKPDRKPDRKQTATGFEKCVSKNAVSKNAVSKNAVALAISTL
jgi:hypothetical protein